MPSIREYFNQLAGYYVLSCIGGVDGCAKAGIKHLAIYYARYGFLHRISVADCVAQSELPAFVRWFKRPARQPASEPVSTNDSLGEAAHKAKQHKACLELAKRNPSIICK